MLLFVARLFLIIISFGTLIKGYTVTPVTEPVLHAECPMWDNRTNRLYFVDIMRGGFHYYDPDNNTTKHVNVPGTVAPILPTTSSVNKFIVGINRTVSVLNWDTENNKADVEVLTTVAENYPNSRTNEGKADRNGRLYIGTMGFKNTSYFDLSEGVLYKISGKKLDKVEPILSTNISNGMAWNKANDKLYYIDSYEKHITEYSYNASSGDLKFSKFAYEDNKFDEIVHPDGMTIDTDDNLWIAVIVNSTVIKVNPKTGELLQTVDIPAKKITSVAFGGRNLDILFVTTSRSDLTDEDLSKQPLAGSVFAVTGLGVKGFPADRVDF